MGRSTAEEVDEALSWSIHRYKFTFGVGGLAIGGMLSEFWREVVPVWAAIAIALLPFAVFTFVRSGEIPARLVWAAHVVASVWYFVVAVGLLASLACAGALPRGWPIYPLFVSIGFIPSGIVLYKAARGSYHVTPCASDAAAASDAATDRGGE